MPRTTRAITVYCASSDEIDPAYIEAAERLGAALARAGFLLVYGGGSIGLMGRVADAVHANAGRVHGIITEKLAGLEQARRNCDELEVVRTMRERKTRMEDLADAFVALPGGLGTFEELFEMLVARTLEDHRKPIVLVNTKGYFDALAALLQRGIDEGFMRPSVWDHFEIVPGPEEAVAEVERLLAEDEPRDHASAMTT